MRLLRPNPPARVAGLLAAAVLVLAACGATGGRSTPSAAPSAAGSAASSAPDAAGAGMSASIIDFGFQPASLSVKAGTTVTWKNTGAVAHTVTANDSSFDSGHVAPGASFQHTFTTAGTYAYHCAIHPAMTATVVVTP